ncbi:unnamed protein product [Zymoseptoria tritici ST99CH_1A5]|uniref:Uncharacterized protein n=2 Tax=Zymoseptoria tritici TaxID=1047171 RepID=A0A2H1FY79_ZYMTR|nr:unnamed protein product [Zymoseptoria tritici ST99CH_1E4]SMR47501.1 unnamed protein product [Zymoseptoria tritici ST99CH_3D1]SMY21401.1 unnamed protein product [Zymoseptoria tritici ST99CH_1A5]
MSKQSATQPRRSQRLKPSSHQTPQPPSPTPLTPQNITKDHSAQSPPISSPEETIHEDDLCPICHLLLHPPVTTTCNHTLCQPCFAYWAETSLSQRPLQVVSIDDEPADFDASDLEAKCPMCRTLTTARLDIRREERLRAQYPRTWRELESEREREREGSERVQTLTVFVGNRHREVDAEGRVREDGASNRHEWTFFVKSSRDDIVEEVQILLHPTFRPSRVIRQRPPFEISRLGWGVFTLTAYIVLKAGYSWASSDAEDSPDGAAKGMLPLEWTLDFDGFGGKGSMGKFRLKVKHDREWEGEDQEGARDAAEWARTVRGYQRDGRYAEEEEEED